MELEGTKKYICIDGAYSGMRVADDGYDGAALINKQRKGEGNIKSMKRKGGGVVDFCGRCAPYLLILMTPFPCADTATHY